jgi:hypothetical protein
MIAIQLLLKNLVEEERAKGAQLLNIMDNVAGHSDAIRRESG